MSSRNDLRPQLNRLICSVLFAAILGGGLPIAAQKRVGTSKPAAAKSVPAAQKKPAEACTGGWSGIVTYKKTQNYTKDFGKQKGVRATTESKVSDDYKYAGRIVVDGSKGSNVLQTRSQVSLKDSRVEWKRTEYNDSCAYDGGDKNVLHWTERDNSDITNAFGEGRADFNLRVDQMSGTYSFSFRFPDAAGVNDRVDKKTAGGYCDPRMNQPENHTATAPAKVDGLGEQIDEQKIDPKRPDVLTGSKSWEEGSDESTKYQYTVAWSFKRCPMPVEVTDLRFDEHPYPDHTAWKEIADGGDTVDGNRVRIRATVVNFSGETRFPTIRFHELVENWQLPEGEMSIRLEAGESRELELEWDTSGYAWKGKGWDAESNRQIKVEAIDEARASQLTKTVVVSPRPVILAHGLWSNAAAWAGYEKYFHDAHSQRWKSYAVGSDPAVAKMNTGETFGNSAQTNTIKQNANELRKQIEFVRKDLNAWHVDIVAHSMGGLIARRYIATMMPNNPLGRKPVVTKLVMLGTPNAGSPCAALMYAGFAAQGKKIWALWELTPRTVEKFNDAYSDRRGVRFSALVGKAIPFTCQSPSAGDGVVTIGSARFKILDWKYSNSVAHTDLTSRADFGNFVFPRLSVGPRGNHDPELLSAGTETVNEGDDVAAAERASGDTYSIFRNAAYARDNATGDDEEESPMGDADLEGLTLAKEVVVKAKQSSEIDINFSGGSRSSVTFVAPPNVSATLVDSAGVVIGRNSADTPESRLMFRTITIEGPAAGGTVKLRLENKGTTESRVFVAAFTERQPSVPEVIAYARPLIVRANGLDWSSVAGRSDGP